MFEWIKKILTKIKDWIMANYATLKAAIESVIKTNGNEEITGEILQNAIIALIESLGAEYQFAGIATPGSSGTNPGTPDYNVMYIAGVGTYPNFGGTDVEKGHIGVFVYNGSWDYETIETGAYFEFEEYPDGAAVEFTFYDSENPDGVSFRINKDVSGISNAPDEAISQWWAAQMKWKMQDVQGYTDTFPSLSTSVHTLGLFGVIKTGKVIDSITGANKLIFVAEDTTEYVVTLSDLPYKALVDLVSVKLESGTASNVSIHVRGEMDMLISRININEIANHPAAYANAATALGDVPTLYRRKGMKVVYFDDTQQTWIEMLNVDDAGPNWWTDVANNWVIEGPIETDITTPTGGKQLMIGGVKKGNLDDVLNVNVWNEQATEYATQAAARAAVPANKRKLGAIITYLVSTGTDTSGWMIDEYIGSSISDWTMADNWKTIGPVSVTQNTLTGNVDVKVGEETILLPNLSSVLERKKMEILNTISTYETAVEQLDNTYIDQNGNIVSSTIQNKVFKFDVSNINECVSVTGRSGAFGALACGVDDNGNVLNVYHFGESKDYVDFVIPLVQGTKYIYVSRTEITGNPRLKKTNGNETPSMFIFSNGYIYVDENNYLHFKNLAINFGANKWAYLSDGVHNYYEDNVIEITVERFYVKRSDYTELGSQITLYKGAEIDNDCIWLGTGSSASSKHSVGPLWDMLLKYGFDEYKSIPFAINGYINNDGDFIDSGNHSITEFIPVKENQRFVYCGTNGNIGISVAGYDSEFNFVKPLFENTAFSQQNLYNYEFIIPNGISYIRACSRKNGTILPSLCQLRDGIAKNSPCLFNKNIVVIGDSISTINGNNAYYKKVLSVDVGQTIQSYVTWFDVYTNDTTTNPTPTGKRIGGVLLTESMVGTLQTFTPVTADIGKTIGDAYNYNSPTTKVWSQILCERTGCKLLKNVSWSGSRMVSGYDGVRATTFRLAYGWSDYTIGCCKDRDENGNDILPDVIIIYRGTNDMSHTPFAHIDDVDLSNGIPATDLQNNMYQFRIAYMLSIQKLRQTYPKATIICCTLNVFKRITYDKFPTRNGIYTLPQINNAIRDIANTMGCGLIEFDKDGITFENCYSGGYITDSATEPTHPNTKGHTVMAEKAIKDIQYLLRVEKA